jgi:hypothetical protein
MEQPFRNFYQVHREEEIRICTCRQMLGLLPEGPGGALSAANGNISLIPATVRRNGTIG